MPDSLGARASCGLTESGAVLPNCLDLGSVGFDFSASEFGPLAVQIAWQTAGDHYTGCAEAGVDHMGYRLKKRYEESQTPVYKTLDEVLLDSKSLPCGEQLGWPLVPFGFYRMELYGSNASGSVVWNTECKSSDGGDLVVDSPDEGSNSFVCRVAKP